MTRILIYPDLKPKGIPYSREHIRRRERDGTFPMHIDLGEGRIAWLEQEIDDWIAELAAKRKPFPIASEGGPFDTTASPATLGDATLRSGRSQSAAAPTPGRRRDR
jgi:prophage regulatory protein